MDKATFLQIFDGSPTVLARCINLPPARVKAWFIRGSIPARYDVRIIAAATARGGKVGPVQLHQLRQSLAESMSA